MPEHWRIEAIEVHQEKGDIGSDVRIAQPFAELDAIDDVDLAGDADVLAAQVAMPFADHPITGTPLEQLLIGLDEAAVEAGDTLEFRLADGVADKPAAFLEVAIDDLRHRLRGAVAHRLVPCRRGVKLRQNLGDCAHVRASDLPGPHQSFQGSLIGQAAHLDRVLGRRGIELLYWFAGPKRNPVDRGRSETPRDKPEA